MLPLLTLLPLAACGRSAAAGEIGFTSAGANDPLLQVVQQTLDSLTRGSTLRLVALPPPAAGQPSMTEVSRASWFASRPGVIGVVGPSSSQAAMETASIYADAGMPHIVTTGTSRLLAGLGPWSFTLAPDDSAEAEFIARVVREVGPRRIVLVHATDLYGWGLSDATVAALRRDRAPLAARVPLGGVGCAATRIPAQLRLVLREGRPDLVILEAHRPEAECAIAAFGPGVRYLVSDGLGATLWPAQAGDLDLAAVTFWDPASSTAAARDFRVRFERLSGRPPTGEQALTFDAALALATAALAIGPDRKRVRDYLSAVGSGRPALTGVTGAVGFHERRTSPLVLLRWKHGQAVGTEPW